MAAETCPWCGCAWDEPQPDWAGDDYVGDPNEHLCPNAFHQGPPGANVILDELHQPGQAALSSFVYEHAGPFPYVVLADSFSAYSVHRCRRGRLWKKPMRRRAVASGVGDTAPLIVRKITFAHPSA